MKNEHYFLEGIVSGKDRLKYLCDSNPATILVILGSVLLTALATISK